jgi:hypothetical protein
VAPAAREAGPRFHPGHGGFAKIRSFHRPFSSQIFEALVRSIVAINTGLASN